MQEDANHAIPTPKQSPLEQGQIDWSQAAAPAEARLGNSHHAPK